MVRCPPTARPSLEGTIASISETEGITGKATRKAPILDFRDEATAETGGSTGVDPVGFCTDRVAFDYGPESLPWLSDVTFVNLGA